MATVAIKFQTDEAEVQQAIDEMNQKLKELEANRRKGRSIPLRRRFRISRGFDIIRKAMSSIVQSIRICKS